LKNSIFPKNQNFSVPSIAIFSLFCFYSIEKTSQKGEFMRVQNIGFSNENPFLSTKSGLAVYKTNMVNNCINKDMVSFGISSASQKEVIRLANKLFNLDTVDKITADKVSKKLIEANNSGILKEVLSFTVGGDYSVAHSLTSFCSEDVGLAFLNIIEKAKIVGDILPLTADKKFKISVAELLARSKSEKVRLKFLETLDNTGMAKDMFGQYL